MHKLLMAALGSLALSVSAPASAAAYHFDIGYSGGGSAFLETGSDNPVGTNLKAGDTFLWDFHAAGPSDYWNVVSGGKFFPFMAWQVEEQARRTGDWSLTLKLDGADVFSTSENGSVQSYLHVGTNDVVLTTGLQFDQMILSYSLTASGSADTTIASIFSIGGQPPEVMFASRIAFVQSAAVPEPSMLLLIGAGILGVARSRRERRD